MTFVITFWTALIGLLFLFGFKLLEIKRKKIFYENVRSRVDLYVESIFTDISSVIKILPKHVSMRNALHIFAHQSILFFAKLAKFVDTKAELLAMKLSHSVRDNAIHRKKKASNFLREVRGYKDSIGSKEDDFMSEH